MKVTVRVSGEIFERGERLARWLGISRSQLYSDALSAFVSVHGTAAVTRQLNEVHGRIREPLDPALALAQTSLFIDDQW